MAFTAVLESAKSDVEDILFMGLLGTECEVEVTDVFGRTGQVPTKFEIAKFAQARGYRTDVLFFGKFDAGFLLPTDHNVELCLIYQGHSRTRNPWCEMTRKLSVTVSRHARHFSGSISAKNPSIASVNWAKVG